MGLRLISSHLELEEHKKIIFFRAPREKETPGKEKYGYPGSIEENKNLLGPEN